MDRCITHLSVHLPSCGLPEGTLTSGVHGQCKAELVVPGEKLLVGDGSLGRDHQGLHQRGQVPLSRNKGLGGSGKAATVSHSEGELVGRS